MSGIADTWCRDRKNMKLKKGDNVIVITGKDKGKKSKIVHVLVKENKVIGVEEKPKQPKSNLAVTGMYLYDNNAFDIIRGLQPSGRGELEITDVNNHYIEKNQMSYHVLESEWTDAGTFDSLLRANLIAAGIKSFPQ